MNYIKLITSAVLLFINVNFADEDPRSDNLNPFFTFNFGYTFAPLDFPTETFNQILSAYRQSGIDMPTQKIFPFTRTLGGAISLEALDGFRIGIEYLNSSSKAFSLYGDKAGNVDLTSSITTNKIGGTFEFELKRIGIFTPFLQFGAGLISMDYDLTERVTINPPYNMTTSSMFTAEGSSFYCNLFLGVNQRFYNCVLIEKVGYHFASVKEPDATIGNMRGTLNESLDISGLAIEFAVGIEL